MSAAGQWRIAFLDGDHVIRLARTLLGPRDAAGERWVAGFFAPEPVDLDALFGLARGLGAGDGVGVADGAGGGSAAGAHAIVFRRGAVTRAMMEAAPGLRLIQRLGAGSDAVDLDAARARSVAVSCLPRRSLACTAEHALLLILALAKRLLPADAALRAGRYDPARVVPADGVAYNWIGLTGIVALEGATLGIVGLGEVGLLVARRAQAFGMRVIYAKRNRLPAAREAEMGIAWRPLPALLAEADFVSLHVPGAPENANLIDAAALAQMRPDAFLVNTSRGWLVDEDALYAALRGGRIAGAALDVHAREPRDAADRFCALPNVVLTPHVAGGSRHGVLAEIARIYDNLRAARAGRPPPHGAVAAGPGR